MVSFENHQQKLGSLQVPWGLWIEMVERYTAKLSSVHFIKSRLFQNSSIQFNSPAAYLIFHKKTIQKKNVFVIVLLSMVRKFFVGGNWKCVSLGKLISSASFFLFS